MDWSAIQAVALMMSANAFGRGKKLLFPIFMFLREQRSERCGAGDLALALTSSDVVGALGLYYSDLVKSLRATSLW